MENGKLNINNASRQQAEQQLATCKPVTCNLQSRRLNLQLENSPNFQPPQTFEIFPSFPCISLFLMLNFDARI